MCKVLPGSQIKNVFDLQNLVTYKLLAQTQPFDEDDVAYQLFRECEKSPYAPTNNEISATVRTTAEIFMRSGYLKRSADNQNYLPYRRQPSGRCVAAL